MLTSGFLFALSIPIYLLFLLIQKKQKVKIFQVIIRSLFYFYIVATIAITLFPLPFQENLIHDKRANNFLVNNFIPFHSIYEIISTSPFFVILKQIGGNIILGMPLGFFLPLIWKKSKSLMKALSVGILFSVGIEAIQFFISLLLGYTYKITDVDDVLLNAFGCILGYVLYKITIPILFDKKDNKTSSALNTTYSFSKEK